MKRKTQKEFEKELYRINPNIQILGEYISSKVKIHCKCKKDNYKWDAIPSNLLRAEGCPKCGGTLKYSQQTFVQKLYRINPNIEVLGKYINNSTKIHCRCKLDNYEWDSIPSSLLSGSGCPKCGGRLQYTQDEFIKKINKINTNVIIIGEYVNAKTKIRCKCKLDGYEWSSVPDSLLHGTGCPVCDNKIVVKGINDIWTTNPELAELLADPEDGYKYTYGSTFKVNWRCPECGSIIKNKQINTISCHGLLCPNCSDGVSYPEKFMYNLLKQLNTKFDYQYAPKWCRYNYYNKLHHGIYDFYIPSMRSIIEMDGGLGHGNKNSSSFKTSEETQFIDDEKDRLAQEHNIKVIRVDCNYEKIDKFIYIKSNILNSDLSKLFDLSKINWNMIDVYSCKSLLIEVCNYRNLYLMTTTQIGHYFNLHYGTIERYLKHGNLLGLCHYNPKEEMKIRSAKNGKKSRKKVICLNTNKVYESLLSASVNYKISDSLISSCCHHKVKSAGKLSDGTKLQWMYYDEYIKL